MNINSLANQQVIDKIRQIELEIEQKRREYEKQRSSLLRENRELKGEWSIQQRQLLETKKEVAQLQTKHDGYLQQHESYSSEIQDVKSRIQLLKGEIVMYEQEMKQMKKELKVEKQQEIEISKKNEIIRRLKMTITDLENNIKSLQMSIEMTTNYSNNQYTQKYVTQQCQDEITIPIYIPVRQEPCYVQEIIEQPAPQYVVEKVITQTKADYVHPQTCYYPMTTYQTCYYPMQYSHHHHHGCQY